MYAMKTLPRRNGFTLVEMAIVLLILGLLLGSGLGLLSAQIEQQQNKDTQKVLDEAKEALIGFAVVNGRLPRPATSAVNGAENPVICADETACTGFIPWSSLGVSKTDAWGKIIRYSVTPAFANAAFSLSSFGTKTIRTRDEGGNLRDLAGQAVCNAGNPCMPAVIFSHGKNNFGTDTAGQAQVNNAVGNVDEQANNVGPIIFYSYRATNNPAFGGGEFDDVLVWLPPALLFNRMIQAGKLP